MNNHTVTVIGNAGAKSLQIAIAGGRLIVGAGITLNLVEGLTMMADSRLGIGVGGAALGQIDAGGDVFLQGELQMRIDAADPFTAGKYDIIKSGGKQGIVGAFEFSNGLGDYVSKGEGHDGLHYSAEAVTLTIDYNLNPGDANLDTITDVGDFNVWNAHKFTDDTEWISGDFNGDGITDVRDFNQWNAAKFTSANGGAPLVEGQVPEPDALALVLVGALTLAACAHRWRPPSPPSSPG